MWASRKHLELGSGKIKLDWLSLSDFLINFYTHTHTHRYLYIYKGKIATAKSWSV